MNQSALFADSICAAIDDPGYYQYGSDIVAYPTDDNDSIICINASNVLLDLGNRYFGQAPGNTVPGLKGINIAPNLTNITIRNGSINGLTGEGIVVGEGCVGITIESVSLVSCQKSGIIINGSSVNHVKNVILDKSLVSSCTGVASNPTYGARVTYGDNIKIVNCTFIDNDASTQAAGYGVSLENCVECVIESCQLSSNGGNDLGIGLSLFQVVRGSINNTIIANTIARSIASKAVGFMIKESQYIAISNCKSMGNNNSLATASGFELIDGGSNTVSQCIAHDNSGATKASGFALRGTESGTSLSKCKSRGNNGGIGGDGYGILIDGPQSCDFWSNQLVGNRGNTGYGLSDTTVSSNNLYAGNVAFKNVTGGFDVTLTLPNVFPSLSVSIGDFSVLYGINKYANISFY